MDGTGDERPALLGQQSEHPFLRRHQRIQPRGLTVEVVGDGALKGERWIRKVDIQDIKRREVLDRGRVGEIINQIKRCRQHVVEETGIDGVSWANTTDTLIEHGFPTSPTSDIEIPIHANENISAVNQSLWNEITRIAQVSFVVRYISDADEWYPIVRSEKFGVEGVPVNYGSVIPNSHYTPRRWKIGPDPLRTNHSVTSRSNRMISSSACFSSASITSSGRGGVYL